MKIRATTTYKKDAKRCKKRHYDMDFLESLVALYAEGNGFSEEDAITYYDHPLSNNWKGHRSFHPYGHNDDWVLVYHIEGDTLVLDNTGDSSTMVLDRTGTHADIYGESIYERSISDDMKITATKKDDILRKREEYDAESKILEDKIKQDESRYNEARFKTKVDLEKKVSSLIGPTTLGLTIDAAEGWLGRSGWEINVRANDRVKFDDNVALAWNWEVKLDQEGNIVKDSGSWSGLKITTPEQIADLEESVRVIKILNNIDWSDIVNAPTVKYSDFMDEDAHNSLRDRKQARPDFESDLQAAELEDLIGGNTAIKLRQDQYYRGSVWILPTGLTDKFIKGYIFPDFYATKYSADEIRESLGDERRSARSNIVWDGDVPKTIDLQ